MLFPELKGNSGSDVIHGVSMRPQQFISIRPACRRQYPGRFDGICSLVRSHQLRPSPKPGRVGSCISLFEACSAFTHVTACTLAKSPSDSLHQRLQQLCCLPCCSDCYRVERTSSRAGLPLLWTATFLRRTRLPQLTGTYRYFAATFVTTSALLYPSFKSLHLEAPATLAIGTPILVVLSIRFLWDRNLNLGRSKELEKLIWQLHRIASAMEHQMNLSFPPVQPGTE